MHHAIHLCPYCACYVPFGFASFACNTDVILMLLYSSFPLRQCTRLDVGEPFRGVVKFSVVNACFEPEDTLDEVHDLVETSFEGVM